METAIAIGIVLLAGIGVGYGLYRAATGKSKCASCHTCPQRCNAHEADSSITANDQTAKIDSEDSE